VFPFSAFANAARNLWLGAIFAKWTAVTRREKTLLLYEYCCCGVASPRHLFACVWRKGSCAVVGKKSEDIKAKKLQRSLDRGQ
jgi:hypothetical protein